MKKEKLLLDRIKKDIKKAKIVSFDIFDTLLVRPYVKPTDLFLHMEKAFERPGFAEERRDAERRTRIRHKELEDVTFNMIYDEIDDEFKDMKQKEMDWEEMVLRANPELKQVYDFAKELGKRIIITSDMYMPTEFLAKVLRKNGFDGWEKLYVSGDLGKTKGRKTLFNHILQECSISPKKILHIGDNKISDDKVPHEIGLETALYTQVFTQFVRNDRRANLFNRQIGENLSSSILLSIFAHEWQSARCGKKQQQSYWQKLGYRYTGPLAYGYSRFVAKEAVERDINHLLFIARDGYTLEKVFNTFDTNIKTSYIYAPRIISMMCTGKMNYESPNYGIEVVVKKLAEFSEELQKLLEVSNPITRDQFKVFYTKNKELILSIAEKNKKRYAEYLDKFITKKDKIALVDLYTTYFSSQTLFNSIFNKDIFSFYFLMYPKAVNIFKNLQFTCFSQTFEKDLTKYIPPNADLYTRFWFFVEFLITSPECPIRDISEDGKPVYIEADDWEKERNVLYSEIADSAVEFAKDVKELFQGHDIFLQYDVITKWINWFIDRYDEIDCKKFSKVGVCISPNNSEQSLLLFSRSFSLWQMLFQIKKTKEAMSKLRWKSKFQRWYIKNWGVFKQKTPTLKIKKIFGITVRKKEIIGTQIKRIKCLGLIKTDKNLKRKKIYFCGIMVRRKNYNPVVVGDIFDRNFINRIVEKKLSTMELHQKTFTRFKGIHTGQDIVILATGNSLNQYEVIKNAIHIGVNRAFEFDKVKLNYIFSQDCFSTQDFIDEMDVYEGNNCQKFYGLTTEWGNYIRVISESHAIKANALRYRTDIERIAGFRYQFAYDLSTTALGCYTSIAFPAAQFALWTNPKRLFLVGCDCNMQKHFAGDATIENLARLIAPWREFKRFVQVYYPETEIISVNPVGLKGIFRDVYTPSFLHKHPEIDPDFVEIIDDGEIQ